MSSAERRASPASWLTAFHRLPVAVFRISGAVLRFRRRSFREASITTRRWSRSPPDSHGRSRRGGPLQTPTSVVGAALARLVQSGAPPRPLAKTKGRLSGPPFSLRHVARTWSIAVSPETADEVRRDVEGDGAAVDRADGGAANLTPGLRGLRERHDHVGRVVEVRRARGFADRGHRERERLEVTRGEALPRAEQPGRFPQVGAPPGGSWAQMMRKSSAVRVIPGSTKASRR